MEEAKWFHEAECPIMDCVYLIDGNCNGHSHAALTSVYRTVQKIAREDYLRSHGFDADKFCSGEFPANQDKEGTYDPDDYRNVHNLKTHTDALLKMNPVKAFNDLLRSFFIVKMLLGKHMKQHLFGNWTEAALGAVVFRNIQICSVNAISVREQVEKRRSLPSVSHLGSTLCTTVSLLNTACNFNTELVRFGDTVVVFAAYPIKAGEEITLMYGENFLEKPKAERQLELKTTYFFDCRCVACVEDWPQQRSLMGMSDKYRCPKCPYKGLVPPQPACPRCGERLKKMWDEFLAYRTEYENFTDLRGDEISQDALDALVKFYSYIDSVTVRPSRTHVVCHTLLTTHLLALGTKHFDRGS